MEEVIIYNRPSLMSGLSVWQEYLTDLRSLLPVPLSEIEHAEAVISYIENRVPPGEMADVLTHGET